MDTLRDALDAVERELAESEPKLAALTKRVTALRQTQAGLRSVLDMEAATDTAPSAAPILRKVVAYGGGAATADGRPTTTEGVRAILAERPDAAMRLDDIRTEFKRRGWVDPDWTRPDSAIYAAVVRLTEHDPNVVREGKKLWKFVTSPPAPQPTNESGALAEVSTS